MVLETKKNLTPKQRKVLEFISASLRSCGFPPTIREIGKEFKFSSTGTVRDYLAVLKEKGYLRLKEKISRGIKLIKPDFGIPILGKVSAGKPWEAIENVEDFFDSKIFFSDQENIFILRAKGDSMIGEGIKENDLLIIHHQKQANNGEIVIAMIEDEALVKKFYRDKNNLRLEAANPDYPPILSQKIEIIGKVIGVVRKM